MQNYLNVFTVNLEIIGDKRVHWNLLYSLLTNSDGNFVFKFPKLTITFLLPGENLGKVSNI